MNRLRGRISIKPTHSGCALCGRTDHGTYQHVVASSDLNAAELRRLADADAPFESDDPFTEGYRWGALVAAGLCFLAVCGSLLAAVLTR